MPLIPNRSRNKPKVAGSSAAIARQTQTTTTYNAGKTALAQIPRPNLDNEQGSSLPVSIREVVPDLATSYQSTLTYARMKNDATVDASLRVVKAPVLGAEFFIEPASGDPQDVLIADFIWENLVGGMSAPFLNSLEDILAMFEDGYSVLEKVYETRAWSPSAKGANAKQYTMLKKLGARPAGTISDIVYDNNGGPKTLKQTAIQADGSNKEIELDISRLIIFTFGKRGGDIRGKSILRTAYQSWYYKNHLYKIDAIQKERHGIGVPRGSLLPGHTADDKAVLRTLLRNLRTNEEAFIMQTPTINIDFAAVEGQVVDVMASAEHHNAQIMLNVLAQFLMLGMGGSSGGGRATAGSGSDIFMKALKYVANSIAQSINMYLIPELIVWNFPTTNFPKLKVRNVGETRDLQMFAAAVANLFSQQALTWDLPTENWIREALDMPAKQPGQPTGVNGATDPNAATPNNAGTNGSSPPPVQPLDAGNAKLQSAQGNGVGNGKGTVKATTGTGNVGKPANAPQ